MRLKIVTENLSLRQISNGGYFKSYVFYVFPFSIFLIFVSFRQWSDGMFLDGLIYATISRNMANGLGSFWAPYYTAICSPFYDHPPLAFWIESLFFRVLGDTIYAERIYSFLTYIFTGYVIILIWREIVSSNRTQLAWLPLLFWVVIPTITWASPNNILEGTMMMFTSLSVYFYIRSRRRNYLMYIFFSGISVSLGFLTKGPCALFPLSIPIWVFLFKKETTVLTATKDAFLLVIFAALPFLLIRLFDPIGMGSLLQYFNQQVVESLSGRREVTVSNRFMIMVDLVHDLLPPVILGLIIMVIGWRKKLLHLKRLKDQPDMLISFFLGLSATLPIVISSKQRSFYIIPSFVFFSISMALLVTPIVEKWYDELSNRQFKILGGFFVMLLFVGLAISFYKAGKIGRDREEIESMYEVLKFVPAGSIISISSDMNNLWGMHAQFARYGNVTLDASTLHNYLLYTRGHSVPPAGYQKISLKFSQYDLYKK